MAESNLFECRACVNKKPCINCGEIKLLAKFPTRPDSPDGRRNECRVCYNARRLRYLRQRSSLSLNVPQVKRCTLCHKEKSIAEFARQYKRPSAYCKTCKCWLEEQRKKIVGHQKWREIKRQYRRFNPWPYRAQGINAAAKAKIVTGDELRELFEASGRKCYYCGSELEPGLIYDPKRAKQIQIDHVIPGLQRKDNLVISCFACNSLKHANTVRTLQMFLEKIQSHPIYKLTNANESK